MTTIGLISNILFISWISISNLEAAVPKAGPFDVVLKRLTNCTNFELPTKSITFEYKLQKHSAKYSQFIGNFTLRTPLDDEATLDLQLAVKTNQGWKENFFNFNAGPMCKGLAKFSPSIIADILRGAGYKKCPIPEGYYPNVALDMNVTIHAMDIMFYNSYKGTLIAKKNNKPMFCMELVAEVIPKRSG